RIRRGPELQPVVLHHPARRTVHLPQRGVDRRPGEVIDYGVENPRAVRGDRGPFAALPLRRHLHEVVGTGHEECSGEHTNDTPHETISQPESPNGNTHTGTANRTGRGPRSMRSRTKKPVRGTTTPGRGGKRGVVAPPVPLRCRFPQMAISHLLAAPSRIVRRRAYIAARNHPGCSDSRYCPTPESYAELPGAGSPESIQFIVERAPEPGWTRSQLVSRTRTRSPRESAVIGGAGGMHRACQPRTEPEPRSAYPAASIVLPPMAGASRRPCSGPGRGPTPRERPASHSAPPPDPPGRSAPRFADNI